MKKIKNGITKIYHDFYYNRLKSYLVSTGTNIKVKEITDIKLQKDVQKVIDVYTLENIFMGQGLNMLVSSFETFLRETFTFYAANNSSTEKKNRENLKEKEKNIEDLINKTHRNKFNFQNLKYASKNFKKYLDIDIKKIFDETGKKQFRHKDINEQKKIDSIGFFEYFNKDIWLLRHKITHNSEVPGYGKEIWDLCFHALNIVTKKIFDCCSSQFS